MSAIMAVIVVLAAVYLAAAGVFWYGFHRKASL